MKILGKNPRNSALRYRQVTRQNSSAACLSDKTEENMNHKQLAANTGYELWL